MSICGLPASLPGNRTSFWRLGLHSLLITSASHPTCLVPPDFFPLVPDVCRKYCLEDKIGPVQAQSSDTGQALRETPENGYGSLGLHFPVVLIC